MQLNIRAYFRLIDISPVDAKQTIERNLKKCNALSWVFRGFSREKDDKDCYIVCFDISFIMRGINYSDSINHIIIELENTGYLDEMKIL